MRLTREETVELMKNLAKLRLGQKPGVFSDSKFKQLAKHPLLPELFKISDEVDLIASQMKTQEDFANFMKKTAVLINTYLDNLKD